MKLYILVFALFLSACATKTGMVVDAGDSSTPVVTSLTNASDKTIRTVNKLQVGQFLCDRQSYRHDDQRVIARSGDFVVYSQLWSPFDMSGCLNAMTKTPWERLGSAFISQIGVPLIKYGTGYAIASKAFDHLNKQNSSIAAAASNAAPKIDGDNNRVIVGDGNDYNEAGGIATSELDLSGGSFSISSATEEEELLDDLCADLDLDGYVDGQTGTLLVEDCIVE